MKETSKNPLTNNPIFRTLQKVTSSIDRATMHKTPAAKIPGTPAYKQRQRIEKSFLFLLLFLSIPALAVPPVVNISNVKLVDRICSVEDVFGFQPPAEKYCTMTYKEVVPGTDGVFRKWTVYCPNAPVDGNALTVSYGTCSDPSAQQINHPTQNYQVIGWLRTPAQAADGKGQVLGYQIGY